MVQGSGYAKMPSGFRRSGAADPTWFDHSRNVLTAAHDSNGAAYAVSEPARQFSAAVEPLPASGETMRFPGFGGLWITSCSRSFALKCDVDDFSDVPGSPGHISEHGVGAG